MSAFFRFSLLDSELFQVSVYKVDTAGFQKVAHWNHSYLVTSLVARESRLFVGDAICSVSVIDVIGTDGGEVRLESIARDFSPLWPMSIGSVDHDTMIGANVSLPPYFTKPNQTNLLINVCFFAERWQPFHVHDTARRDTDDPRSRRVLQPRRRGEQVCPR